MNGQAILSWIKSNVVIVVCLVVILGAPASLWYVSSGWNLEVKSDVAKRGRQLDTMASAGKADLAWPGAGESTSIVVTPSIISAYRDRAELLKGQANAVVQQAKSLNAAGFTNPFTELLPYPHAASMTDHIIWAEEKEYVIDGVWDVLKDKDEGWNEYIKERWEGWDAQKREEELAQALQVVPGHLHKRLIGLYEDLLTKLSAGSPPDPKDVDTRLASVQESYAEGHADSGSLTDEEREGLAEKLGIERLAMYEDRAGELSVYLTMETLNPPMFASTDIPEHEAIVKWMWRYWVLQRMVESVSSVNKDMPEPTTAIKRIERIAIRGLLALETPEAGGRTFSGSGGNGRGGGPPRGGPGGGGGGPPKGGPGGGPPRGPGGGGGGPPMGGPGGGGGAPPMGGPDGGGLTGPTAPQAGATDPSKSITGRISNQLYDVVLLDLELIVATDRIDDVLEAFSMPIKTAVLDMQIQPADAYEALGSGYFYGSGSMTRLVLTVETLWLREWTHSHLPDTVLSELGFPPRVYEQPQGSENETY